MIIIFDLDGTLFETQPCIVNAVKQLFLEKGLPQIEENKILQNIGKKSHDFLSSILPEYINPDEIYEQFSLIERNEIKKSGRLFSGISNLLDELKDSGHIIYLCSNGSEEYIDLVLKKTEIKEYFAKVISAKSYKTKTEAIENILEKDPCAIIIGDTESDIEAAVNNHIPSIGASYGYGKQEELLNATFVAEDIDDIYYYVKQIEIFYLITKNLNIADKKIVGINGVDTSGKTTFTNQFSKFLISIGVENAILHIDDFHNPYAKRIEGTNEIDAYYKNAFNYQQVIDEILKPLRENRAIDKNVLCLNLDTDKYENIIRYKIDEDMILLVEGVLLFRDPLINYFDTKIYLHIDFDEVIKRARVRDVPKYGEVFLQKYINKYIPVQKKYITEDAPIQKSDIVIDNNDYLCPKICGEFDAIVMDSGSIKGEIQ